MRICARGGGERWAMRASWFSLCLPLVVHPLLGATDVPATSPLPLERMILVAPTTTTREDAAITHWQARLHAAPGSAHALESLGWAFVTKARATLDDGYYTLAAATAEVLARQPEAGPRARLLQAHVLHNQHRFAEAEELARRLVAEQAGPDADALLSDVVMEQGRLPEAIAACQRFVAARPGLESYARVAHLRWLSGDLDGAIAAMDSAVRAGASRRDSSLAWALTRLAGYRLQRGELSGAEAVTASALHVDSGYPPALLMRGRVLLAMDRAAEAVEVITRAVSVAPLLENLWWAAEAQRAAGQCAAADATEAELIRQGEAGDPRTLALFLATRGYQPTRSLALARDELRARQDVFTHDAVAWSAFAAGELDAADAAMARALAAGTRDARLALHAGAIARARGQDAKAQLWLGRAAAQTGTLTPSERERLALESAALRPATLAQLSSEPVTKSIQP